MHHHVIILVGINLLSTLVTIVTTDFLGTTCTRLTHELSKMGKMIPVSNSLRTLALTTSFVTLHLNIYFKNIKNTVNFNINTNSKKISFT